MNGKTLYELYTEKHLLLNNCSHDVWDDLSHAEQQVWEAVAREVSPPPIWP